MFVFFPLQKVSTSSILKTAINNSWSFCRLLCWLVMIEQSCSISQIEAKSYFLLLNFAKTSLNSITSFISKVASNSCRFYQLLCRLCISKESSSIFRIQVKSYFWAVKIANLSLNIVISLTLNTAAQNSSIFQQPVRVRHPQSRHNPLTPFPLSQPHQEPLANPTNLTTSLTGIHIPLKKPHPHPNSPQPQPQLPSQF